MLDASEWDDAFELISRFGLRERLPLLIERGLRTVLSDGRLAAVEKWVAWASQERLDGPELALARAEIYLCHGDWELSKSLAVTCVDTADLARTLLLKRTCARAQLPICSTKPTRRGITTERLLVLTSPER